MPNFEKIPAPSIANLLFDSGQYPDNDLSSDIMQIAETVSAIRQQITNRNFYLRNFPFYRQRPDDCDCRRRSLFKFWQKKF
jgi:hypothetical protein